MRKPYLLLFVLICAAPILAQDIKSLSLSQTGCLPTGSVSVVDNTLYAATTQGIMSLRLEPQGNWETWQFGGEYVKKMVFNGNGCMVLLKDKNEYITGKANDRLMISTDGGSTFHDVTGEGILGTNGVSVWGVAACPGHEEQWMCSTDKGLFETTDGGAIWTKLTDISDSFIAYSPQDSQIRYMCGSSDGFTGTVYVSRDGGIHWTYFSTDNFDDAVHNIDFHPRNPSTLCYGSWYATGVSTDYGDTWQVHPLPTTPKHQGGLIMFDRDNGDMLYYIFMSQGTIVLRQSDNYGEEWFDYATLAGIEGEEGGWALDMVQQGRKLYFSTRHDVYVANLGIPSGIRQTIQTDDNHNTHTYDVNGMQIPCQIHGVYIQNGRKVVVK
jgi:hypothetical protein